MITTMDNNKSNKHESTPSPSPSPSPLSTKDQISSPKKPPPPPPSATAGGGGGGGGGDRLKRDEWSEGAVSCLLEAYEAKWVLRNRAKLKGHDWEDVAKYVSSRANTSKSPKTQTQCKNKIESMKKRYRSESATADVSSWPLFHRLDLLLRGSGGGGGGGGGGSPVVTTVGDPPPISVANNVLPLMAFDHAPAPHPPPVIQLSPPVAIPVSLPVATLVNQVIGQNSVDSNGVDRENKDDVVATKLTGNQVSEKMEIDTDCSTPALYSNEKEKIQTKNHKTRITANRKRRRKGENWDVAESIRWLAKVMVKSEQAKVETMRELEKMRADAEIKRGEIDLKRTEIIAHTQLEIARLFATSFGKSVDPSLRIGRS